MAIMSHLPVPSSPLFDAGSGTVCTWGSYLRVAPQSCQALPFPLALDRCSTSAKMGVLDKGLAAWLTVTKVLTPYATGADGTSPTKRIQACSGSRSDGQRSQWRAVTVCLPLPDRATETETVFVRKVLDAVTLVQHPQLRAARFFYAHFLAGRAVFVTENDSLFGAVGSAERSRLATFAKTVFYPSPSSSTGAPSRRPSGSHRVRRVRAPTARCCPAPSLLLASH